MSVAVFGPFAFDSNAGALARDGRPIPIGGRGAALLAALIDADGAAVGKDALISAGWPGTIVEEGNLSVQIANLRKALGTRPDGQEWISTVPRVGYRLLKAAAPAADTPTNVWPSIAVLPFDNLSGDPEQEYFADGVVEDIITALSRFKSFAVVARNSSFVYKGRAVDVREVGEKLGVRYVLEGSVRRAGNRLRITAQLIEAQSGMHLWAQHYDGALDDVFDFQDRITESVVGVIEPQIQIAEIKRSHRDRPDSLTAYDLYLRGTALYSSQVDGQNAEAVRLLSRAVELEPNNPVFLAAVAQALQQRAIVTWQPLGPDDEARVVGWVERAIANAGGDALVLAQCGVALIHYMKDYERGMAATREAAKSNPNNMWVLTIAGIGCLHCGTIEESIAFSERALRLCPGDVANHWALTAISHARMILGDYEEALTWAQRSLTVNPNFGCTYWMLIAANAQMGRLEEARRLRGVFQSLEPGATVARIWAGQPQKDPERMRAILEGLRLAGLPEA